MRTMAFTHNSPPNYIRDYTPKVPILQFQPCLNPTLERVNQLIYENTLCALHSPSYYAECITYAGQDTNPVTRRIPTNFLILLMARSIGCGISTVLGRYITRNCPASSNRSRNTASLIRCSANGTHFTWWLTLWVQDLSLLSHVLWKFCLLPRSFGVSTQPVLRSLRVCHCPWI
jgi:hypothetical protein